jgi:SAM-dependent methyltransferase
VSRIDRKEGRRLFGSDPAAYDAARPGHAERVYEILVARCGLRPGTSVLEIGPGTGQATRRLLQLGAKPLVAVEPDPALAAYLDKSVGKRLDLHSVPLEDAQLPSRTFDLAVAASSFHWIDEELGLAKVFAALRPGGWWAMWWTLFGDESAPIPDAFSDAIDPLMDSLPSSPSEGEPKRPRYALDVEARTGALATAGFESWEHELTRWCYEWDTAGIRALFATFSSIARLEESQRETVLDSVARVAADEFGGIVRKPIMTSIYTAHRAE